MNKVMSFLKRHSIKISLIAGVSAAAVIGLAATSAWGPSRETHTVENPADYITFNSITNNPSVGDEREFVSIKDAANTNNGGWRDSVTVEPGKEYLVRMYAHNNAASSLNLTALNTRVKANVPTTTAKTMQISGFVSADNARPAEVWDDIRLSSDKNFNLAYVPGSARIYNNGYAAGGNGQPLPDSIVTSAGAKIGYNGPDGKVPGCFEYANYIYFKVKPQFAQELKYEIQKTVRKTGTTGWQESVAVKPGDSVDYLLKYANIGTATQNSVVLVDKLPEGMTLVPNSTYLKNGNHPTNDYKPANQTGIVNGGLAIGHYLANSSAYVWFSAKVPEASKLKCGPNVLKNWAYGAPAGQTPDSDDADVTVNKECVENPQFKCEALEADRLNIKLGEKANFTARGSASGGATITGYIFKVNGAVVQDSASNQYVFTGNNEGTYNVSVIVKTNKGNTAETDNCKKQVKVTKETPKPVYECTSLKAVSLGNNKYRFTTTTRVENGATVNKYLYNFGDNTQELSTTNATVEHTYPGAGEYVAKVRVVFNVGNEQKTVESANCEVTTVIKENPCPYNPSLPKDSKDCKETPGNPEKPPVDVIPSTGAAGVATGIFGASMTAYGAFALVEKRRALRK